MMKIWMVRIFVVLATFCSNMSMPTAQLTWSDVLDFEAPVNASIYSNAMLAKTSADECFDGIGVDYPPINPDGTCDIGTAKKNEAYIWGLTQAGIGEVSFSGPDIWFGTLANALCLSGGIADFGRDPYITPSWVCEFEQSQLARTPGFPLSPQFGDWRRPRAYSYDIESAQLRDETPSDLNFALMTGVRSAGSLGKAVFLAGTSFQGGVVFAAWDAETRTYKGSCRAIDFGKIRTWIVVNDTLYAGAAVRNGGAILRWNGTVEDPFNGSPPTSSTCGFEVVGSLPAFPAFLASYNDERLAASAWPPSRVQATLAQNQFPAGIYISPPFGVDGKLSKVNAEHWVKIWGPSLYEPDKVVAAVTSGGAIAYWKGFLWFGTMNHPSGTVHAHSNCPFSICYGTPNSPTERIDLLFNVQRATSIWRARILASGAAEVELLYGEAELPALVPGTKQFERRPTGFAPKFGGSGFDTPFNTYAWTAVARDQLFFGTLDQRYTLDVGLGIVSAEQRGRGSTANESGVTVDETRGYGGDLWRFDDVDSGAQPERVRGLGNFTNYGFRTMIPFGNGSNFLVGTANPMSLEPDGGWELHLFSPNSP